ncbi:MAG: hypothetical protein M3Q39_01565 [Actinomycetota bacterium]|nr:hypothetical protein [Actinomycetota bacterium]
MSAGNGPCTSISGDGALIFVDDGWATFRSWAAQAYTLTTSQIQGLNNFQASFATWDASWAAGDGTLTGFIRPTKPDLPAITITDLSGTIPAAPTVAIVPIVLDAAPGEPGYITSPPDLNLTVNAPAPLTATRPGDVPDLQIPDEPVSPTILTYTAPTLVTLEMPATPVVTIEEFDEAAPEFTAAAPNETLEFTESPYVSAFLDAVKGHLTNLMNGQVMPDAVEDALWSKALDRDEQASFIALQQVDEDFASRGFSPEPNGLWATRRLEVRQQNRNKRAELNRDVYLENQKVAVENVRMAVNTGVQLEGTLIQAHLQVEQRKFDLIVKGRDIAIAVFQARIAQFNSIVQAYNARISAYQAFLDGQKAKVEIFKAQVEAEKAKAEVNTQLVNLYEAQIRSEISKVEIYRAQIEGFRARVEAERTRIEGHRSGVEAYKAQVEAYKVEWDAERTRVDAEARRGDLYNSMVNAYATRVNVWQTKGEARIQEHRANLANAQAQLQQHDAQVRGILGKLEAYKAMVQAQSAQSDSLARMYQAEAGVESTAVDADSRAFTAMVGRENTRLAILLKDAELQVSQFGNRSNLLLRAMESAANASSQLAASSMSAVNFSAGISSSVSRGEQCSTAFTYSGEIADA